MRDNVLLMGDIVEDCYMVDPSRHNQVLSIGYLNDMNKNSHLLDNYMEFFDIMICGDGPTLPANHILQSISGQIQPSFDP